MRALILLALLLLLYGCTTPGSDAQTSPPPQADGWLELAPGIRYQLWEGQVSLDYKPSLFTAEGVAKFEKFAQEQMSKATTEEERRHWEEEVAWVKEQYAIWSNEELVVDALEGALQDRFLPPLSDAERQALRAKLEEIVRLMKQGVDPQSLPPELEREIFRLMKQGVDPQSLPEPELPP